MGTYARGCGGPARRPETPPVCREHRRREEPPTRCWPHPVSGVELPPPEGDGMMHYLRCALSYQNQTLAEIKTLLERLEQRGEGGS